MRTVAFVPVKLNNQRTPGKNIRRFDDGTPLLTLFLKTLVRVKGLDAVYVFCSDDSIKEYLIQGVSFLKRPEYLDTQKATPQDIIYEFMKRIDADVYAVCHCTSPFVKCEHFEECIEAAKSNEFDSSFTAERLQQLMWIDGKPMNFDPASIPRTQDLPVYYSEVPAIYAFKKEVFLRYKRRIGVCPHITTVSEIEGIDIDYPEDFEIANAVYMKIVKKSTWGGYNHIKINLECIGTYYHFESEVA